MVSSTPHLIPIIGAACSLQHPTDGGQRQPRRDERALRGQARVQVSRHAVSVVYVYIVSGLSMSCAGLVRLMQVSKFPSKSCSSSCSAHQMSATVIDLTLDSLRTDAAFEGKFRSLN